MEKDTSTSEKLLKFIQFSKELNEIEERRDGLLELKKDLEKELIPIIKEQGFFHHDLFLYVQEGQNKITIQQPLTLKDFPRSLKA